MKRFKSFCSNLQLNEIALNQTMARILAVGLVSKGLSATSKAKNAETLEDKIDGVIDAQRQFGLISLLGVAISTKDKILAKRFSGRK